MPAQYVAVHRERAWSWAFRRRGRTFLFCYLGLAPVLFLFCYIPLFPLALGAILTLFNWDFVRPPQPVFGLAHYVRLAHDGNFLLALKNTTVCSLATVLCSTLIALPLAVFLAGRSRVAVLYQTIYFLPVITPVVPMAIAWKWIYDYNYGLFNYGLSLVGGRPIAWLTNPAIALWALIIMSVWKVLGYNLILFLVGIRNIPAIFLESASLDGATAWQ